MPDKAYAGRRGFAWIFFVAGRYFSARRKTRGLAPSILSAAGIAVGVMTLVTVLAVMNGFQLSYVEDILEISSFHIRITGSDSVDENLCGTVRGLKYVRSVLPFLDVQTLVQGLSSGLSPCIVRGVPANAEELDPGLVSQLSMYDGVFSVSSAVPTIVLGYELSMRLSVGPGDRVTLVSLAGEDVMNAEASGRDFLVTGVFKSGYFEFDNTLAFVNIDAAKAMSYGNQDIQYGVKLENRERDRQVLTALGELPGPRAGAVSWREYNKAFFGALRMEKVAMILIIGLIFVVVGANIFQSLRRSVYEKQEEIGILRALGAYPEGIRNVFILDGVFIGFLGGTIGTALGLFLSAHINGLFAFLDWLINLFVSIHSRFTATEAERFSLFSESYFYISEIPTRILFPEVLLIFLFAFLSSIMAAYIASKRVSLIHPREVLSA
jgi:lipoprotein-releasing system permease protein